MNADLFDLLCAADPAATMPETASDDRERLRRAIVATPIAARGRYPRQWQRPRLALVLAVGGATIALGGTAVWAATVMLAPPAPPPTPAVDAVEGPSQVLREYTLWTTKLPLPPGASWGKLDFPAEGIAVSGNTGVMAAMEQAIGQWAKECIAAGSAGDSQRVAAAIAALRQIRAIMPVFKQGMSENQGGYMRWQLLELDTAIDAASKGNYAPLGSFVAWTEPQNFGRDIKPLDPVLATVWYEWTPESGSNTTAPATTDQARTEYLAFEKTIALPPGVKWEDVYGSEFTGRQYGQGEGFMHAYTYAWVAWWREWVAAAFAGDTQRAANARAASRDLFNHVGLEVDMSIYAPGERNVGQWVCLKTAAASDYYRIENHARRGDFGPMVAWLQLHQDLAAAVGAD